ncbi:C2 domain-containing protein [Abeliophyllum distichum]|uniref:C2 domain-containing protein n=1 Tax=Abeliophyllum distichum TaxID=126358 RepID=A0ABD1RW20_9LAMI
MAYASLLSLNQTLDQIPHPDYQTEQKMIRYLHEKVSFLLSFLDVSSPIQSKKISGLEGRIKDAAYEAKDIIETSMLNQIVSEYRTESHMSNQNVSEWDQKFQRLQRIKQELKYILD